MRKRWVAAMRDNCKGSKDVHERSFDLLNTHPRVLSIYVSGKGRIEVESQPVFWRHPDTTVAYYLGKYRVLLDLPTLRIVESENGFKDVNNSFEVVCVDSGRHDGKMEHAHSNVNFIGQFCFGDRNTYLAQLLEQKEYPAAIYLVLDSLWNVEAMYYAKVKEGYKEARSLSTTAKGR